MFCYSCGSPILGGARYCIGCGAKVLAASSTAHPPNLTERKFVTIVFIDMVGSLSAIRDKDPEDAHELLTSAMGLMAQAVRAFGGVVAETAGDGIMAIFGAPAAQEDHALRACFAALRLHSLVAQGMSGRLSLRVGINSGEVAVGTVPNDFSSDYTATGAVVHIAARLQAFAQPNETVLTEQTASLVRDAMITQPIGPSTLKGLTETILLHRLMGPHPPAARQQSARSRAFVGRASELDALDTAVAAARGGYGCAVGVSGEAGIGKTALIDQFVQRHESAVQLVRCTVEYHAGVAPLRPFADVMSQLLGLEPLSPPQRREALSARLLDLSLPPEVFEAALMDLLGLEGAPASWRVLSPLIRGDLVDSAVTHVLTSQSRSRSLVVVLEDLQRADSATLELVGRIIRSASGGRLLLILAFRPELSHGWGAHENYRELRLECLDEEDTRGLVSDLLGQAAPSRIESQLIGWSKGNPLFLRESIRALREAGVMDDPDAAASISVPPSINDAIAARIDRLAAPAKRVLLAASVLGKTFVFDLLSDVSGVEREALSAQVDTLVKGEFVRALQPAAGIYGFEHGLFQEVGYATLLRSQRRDLHRAAFTALGRSSRDHAHLSNEALAHHAFGGELWAQAVPVCHEAGRRAAARYSNREAALHLENAIAALARADVAGTRIAEAIDLRLELRSVCLPLLRLDRIGELLAETDDLARRLGDPARRVSVTAYLASHAYMTEGADRCIERCRDALALADGTSDPKLRIAPTLYMAQANYALGQFRRVVAALEREPSLLDPAIRGGEVGLPVRPIIMRGYWMAIAQAELGDFDTAQALSAEMFAAADDRQPFESLYARTAQGFIAMQLGDFAAALAFSASALDTAEHYEITFIIPVLASQVGFLMASQGRVPEGLMLARRALRKAGEIGVIAGFSRWCARASEVCLLAGETDEARRHATAAIDFAEREGGPGYLCSALRLQARIKTMDADVEGAAHDLELAIDIAREFDLGPALGKCHFDCGVVAHRRGRLADAYRELELARDFFVRHGMSAGVARASEARARLESGDALPDYSTLFGSAE